MQSRLAHTHRLCFRGAVFAVCLGVVAILGCRSSPAAKYRIGVILAASGPADFIGKPEKQVLDALWKTYSEHSHTDPSIQLDFKDSMGKIELAASSFKALASDPSVMAIIGPSTSGESIPLAKEADAMGIPLLSLAASRQIVFDEQGRTRPWVFKFAQNDDLAARRLASSMIEQGHLAIALLYSNDGFGKSGAAAFREVVEEAGTLKIVHESPFDAALTTPEPLVAAIPASAQCVLVWGTAPGPSLLVKALRQAGRSTPLYLSHGNASQEFVNTTGLAAEGAVVVGSRVLLDPKDLKASDPADAVLIRFRSFWQERFPPPPSHFGGHARDALEAFLAVTAASPPRSRKDVRDGLEKLQNFPGVTGTFNFSASDHAGLTIDAFATYRVKAGSLAPYERTK